MQPLCPLKHWKVIHHLQEEEGEDVKRNLAVRNRLTEQIHLLPPRDCPDPFPSLQLCFFQLALGVNEFLAEAKNSGCVRYKLFVYGMTEHKWPWCWFTS